MLTGSRRGGSRFEDPHFRRWLQNPHAKGHLVDVLPGRRSAEVDQTLHRPEGPKERRICALLRGRPCRHDQRTEQIEAKERSMKLRERLADWISGGALTQAREDRRIQAGNCGGLNPPSIHCTARTAIGSGARLVLAVTGASHFWTVLMLTSRISANCCAERPSDCRACLNSAGVMGQASTIFRSAMQIFTGISPWMRIRSDIALSISGRDTAHVYAPSWPI